MKIDLGTYELDCDFDPREQFNNDKEKLPIEDIGFIYNCVFKQQKAFEYSVESIQKIYPKSKIYVVSDGGLDYTYMEDENIKVSMEEDCKSPLKKIDGENFLLPEHQEATKKEMAATIRRMEAGIKHCNNPEWICATEPDVLIRDKISYPKNGKLLGSRINYAWVSDKALEQFMGLNDLISKVDGSIPVLRWGAVPIIFHTQTFLKALKVYKENFDIMDKFSERHYAPGTFDLFIGLIFALIGEPEVYNTDITECLRNPSWKTSNHPVVHQYRVHYEKSDHY